jgi:transcriptional regulator with XRE-family HTH domain
MEIYFYSLASENAYTMETSRKSTATVDESHLKLIMGLKLKQLRSEKGMSLTQLAHATDISISYLNEIEKGKKFPKPDKIAVLANTLDVSYDWLVSVKMNKKLAPVADILQSKIMKEILLDVFGIDKNQMLDLLSRVPVKLNAFLNTIIEISRNYGMRVENFYQSALRSYQEMHENYFDDIEKSVDDCVRENAN